MSDNNPAIVIDAITETAKTFGKVTINPITIFRYAYLERVKSPFIAAETDFSVENIAPTIYILSLPKQELKRYYNDIDTLKIDSLDWADESLALDDIPAIISEITSKFTAMNKASPNVGDGAEDTKKK